MSRRVAARVERAHGFLLAPLFYAIFGLGVLIALVLAAQAKASEDAPASKGAPGLCEMVAAFDEALQMRFYRANYAPDRLDCHFYASDGCPFSTSGAFRIKVTHVAAIGCEAGGDCAFLARQVCETDGPSAACFSIMPAPQAQYRVKGRFHEEGGAWRLTDWMREAGPALSLERADIATQCPELRAPMPG